METGEIKARMDRLYKRRKRQHEKEENLLRAAIRKFKEKFNSKEIFFSDEDTVYGYEQLNEYSEDVELKSIEEGKDEKIKFKFLETRSWNDWETEMTNGGILPEHADIDLLHITRLILEQIERGEAYKPEKEEE